MDNNMPRVLFAAPKSGSGKTMITCGVIEVFKRRRLKVAALKCGPDYIDPMFHRQVLGVPSGNLDGFFTDDDLTRYLLGEKAKDADITVIEGVMGYYDGLGGQSERASTYDIARITETPVVLIVDAKGASVSLAAIVKGLMEYRQDSRICGVLLNKISSGYYDRLKVLIERECRVKVLGYIPELRDAAVPSRHLGLLVPQEITAFQEWVGKIADQIERTVEVDRLLEIAGRAAFCSGQAPQISKLPEQVRLAVAKDEAFSFHYIENLDLLANMGAKIIFFSPLHDKKLPDDIDGIILGGGYPELYAAQLESNQEIRAAIKKSCENGMPCLAECGGFLYLQEELEDMDGTPRAMSGVLSGKGYRTDKLCRFGYIETEILTSGILGDVGQRIKGHEFHYWDCTENGNSFLAKKPLSSREYPCMVHTPTMAAGFPHFYYYSNPQMIYQFLEGCLRFRKSRKGSSYEQ